MFSFYAFRWSYVAELFAFIFYDDSAVIWNIRSIILKNV